MPIESLDTGDVTLSCQVEASAGDDAPLVIAIHGFPDSRETFASLVPSLVAAGRRVVVPTLRGYAPSGLARSGRHHALGVADDVLWLADHLSPGRPVELIGHDWGALAAFNAVARAPQRFAKLVTMSVPHPAAMMSRVRPAQLKRSWYIAMFQLPLIAESKLAKDDLALIDRLWREWSPGYAARAGELEAVKAGIRGRIAPVLAYYRALASPAVQKEARINFSPVEVPSIHLHGVDDGCVGIECADGAEAHYRSGYALHPIAGAGHFLMHEKPAEVARIVVDFLGPRGSGRSL